MRFEPDMSLPDDPEASTSLHPLGAAQVLRLNEHVRVDLFYGRWKPRSQGWLDLLGFLLFLLPVMVLMTYLSWPILVEMFVSG